MGLIILPQALKNAIPPVVNQFISMFKDTSLVIIIGLFDLLTTAKTAVLSMRVNSPLADAAPAFKNSTVA